MSDIQLNFDTPEPIDLNFNTPAAINITFAQGTPGPEGPVGATGATGPQGPTGATGAQGTPGQGVPTGGTAGQVLSKINSTNYNTQWVDPSGGSDGNGIYDGDGTVPSNTKVTLADQILFGSRQDWPADTPFDGVTDFSGLSISQFGQLRFRQQNAGDGKDIDLSLDTGNGFSVTAHGEVTKDFSFIGLLGGCVMAGNDTGTGDAFAVFAGYDGAEISVNNPSGRGNSSVKSNQGSVRLSAYQGGVGVGSIEVNFDPEKALYYAADYSAIIAVNDTSIPDVGTLKAGLIPHIPRQSDDASALNGETFYSTDQSKLCYKDPGGTVNPLY